MGGRPCSPLGPGRARRSVARALLTLLVFVDAAAQTRSPSPSPWPARCTSAIFEAVWDREVRYSGGSGCLHVDRVTTFPLIVDSASGQKEDWCAEDQYRSVRCKAQIMTLAEQPFGPPSAFEVMNAVCKGECQNYYNVSLPSIVSARRRDSHPTAAPARFPRTPAQRLMRVAAAERLSGCHCADLKSLCPRHPVDILFDVTGIRYDPSSCEFRSPHPVTQRIHRRSRDLTHAYSRRPRRLAHGVRALRMRALRADGGRVSRSA